MLSPAVDNPNLGAGANIAPTQLLPDPDLLRCRHLALTPNGKFREPLCSSFTSAGRTRAARLALDCAAGEHLAVEGPLTATVARARSAALRACLRTMNRGGADGRLNGKGRGGYRGGHDHQLRNSSSGRLDGGGGVPDRAAGWPAAPATGRRWHGAPVAPAKAR
jgi:hypothetical protein